MAKNQWIDEQGTIIISEKDPNKGLEFEEFAPVVNERRVRGATYVPYAGNSEWVQAANRLLQDLARSNFETRR